MAAYPILTYKYLIKKKRKRNSPHLYSPVCDRDIRSYLQRRKKVQMFVLFLLRILFTDAFHSRPRSLWMKQRSSIWWDTTVLEHFTNEDWIENFRMHRDTFEYICGRLEPYLTKKNSNMRTAISVKKRVAVTIWRLATNAEYRTIGHLFGIARCTVCKIVNRVCRVISKVLQPAYVKLPNEHEIKEIMNGFERRWGFPQCWGAIDGTHIPIIRPRKSPNDYFNRKGWHSIVMQSVVDHTYRFMDVCIGWPGSVHDARVLARSNLYQRAEEGVLIPTGLAGRINNIDIPPLLLGDAAYPLLPWLMKPYPDTGALSVDQKRFNYKLSQARMVVENAYGRLKGRWRCLMKRYDSDIKNLNNTISACVTLHNICETYNATFRDAWMQPEIYQMPRGNQREVNNNGTPQSFRNAISEHLRENSV